MKRIAGAEYALSKIFSSDFEFVIPSYQRPYAWTVEQTSDLIDDLITFSKGDDEDGYFLGSIVLIKNDDAPLAEVIDGQQRLTTITILLAAAAFCHNGANKDETRPYIIEPGKKIEGIKAKPRLSLRERDRQFFTKYVQNLQLDKLLELEPASLANEAQANIQSNARFALSEIESRFKTAEEVAGFLTFVLTRCYLVAVSTPSQESAFRVFSVLNSRGLDLQPTDIIKADIIGRMTSEADRKEYNAKWEDMEVDLSRSGFSELFSHIRMIFARVKAKTTTLSDFRSLVLPQFPDPKAFVDDVLTPYADAFTVLKNSSYMSTKHAEDVNFYLKWLNRIDNSDWIPPAMLFLNKYKNKPQMVLEFFKLLERCAAYLHAMRYNVNNRIELYAAILVEIEKGILPANLTPLQFGRRDTKQFREALNGNIYQLTPRRRNYLILRLDSFVSDGAASYDPKILTIEHVLPQTVSENSEWAEWWPNEEQREEWVHRLSNLVPLNKKRNSAAQNFDFQEKIKKYFGGSNNVSSYALTTQVLAQKEWRPSDLKLRQKRLVDAMMLGWGLT